MMQFMLKFITLHHFVLINFMEIFLMTFAAAAVPVIPVRKEPSHTSEMVNQLLFGETVEVLEEKDSWCRVLSLHDDYDGWVQALQLESIDRTLARSPLTWVLLPEAIGDQIDCTGKEKMFCPLGSVLTGFDGEEGTIGNLNYTYSGIGAILFSVMIPTEKAILQQVQLWYNTPYLWGGRTLMGADCSGFIQVLFRSIGIELLRDAVHQASEGEVIDFLQQAQCGDLAFFDDAEGNIQHVGVLLSPFEIVHAYGKVRKDKMDHEGIINAETGERTHRLRIIKRYF